MSVFCTLASPFSCSQKSGVILLLLIAVAPVSSVVGAGGAGDLSVSGGSGDAPVVEVDAAKTFVRSDPMQSVRMLSRHSFKASVSQENVDNWIVFFCVDWYEVCQHMWQDYRAAAVQWEHNLVTASSWQNTAVRFAEVDCATDKALCNENNVQSYPSLVHYKGGKFSSAWQLSVNVNTMKELAGDISKWIGKVLHVPADVASSQTSLYASMSDGLQQFSRLLSSQDPRTATRGVVMLLAIVSTSIWMFGTVLDLDLRAVISTAKKATSLPELPEAPESRAIVRDSFEL